MIQTLNCTFSGSGKYNGPDPKTYSFTNQPPYVNKTWGGETLVFLMTDIPPNAVGNPAIAISGYCPILALDQPHTCLKITGKAIWADGTMTNWVLVANLPELCDSFNWTATLAVFPLFPGSTNTMMSLGGGIISYDINAFAPFRPPKIIPPNIVPNTNRPGPQTPGGNAYSRYAFEFITDIGTNENWTFTPDPTVKEIAYYNDTNSAGTPFNVFAAQNLTNWTLVDTQTEGSNGVLILFETSTNANGQFRIKPQ